MLASCKLNGVFDTSGTSTGVVTLLMEGTARVTFIDCG